MCGFASLPLIVDAAARVEVVSPSDCEVIEPPTSSVATVSPVAPSPVRTSPAMNVWMSPVTKTTSLIFLSRMWVSSSSRSCG